MLGIEELRKGYKCRDAGEDQALASLDALQNAVKDREAAAHEMVKGTAP